MVRALGGFDPEAIYGEASSDYEDAARDYWQYLSVRTVERLRLRPGGRVLDVPCGPGHGLLAAAERVGPSGRVTGIDYADRMVAMARDKVPASGLTTVEVHRGDMTALTRPEEPYDAVLCVLGVFFVDDMPGLVRSLAELLLPDGRGRLAVTVFGERFFDPMRHVFVAAVQDVAPGLDVVQPWCRTEDASVLRRVFQDAGLADVTIDTDDDTLPLPTADDWWRIVMGSGLRRTVAAMDTAAAAEVRARCTSYIEAHSIREVDARSRYAIVSSPSGA
jgi:ubiquinone/menaquinone biosynthesis C-methylase UbiE